MAKAGKRYPLLIYKYTLNKWYPATLAVSIILFILWWYLPVINPKPKSNWQDTVLLTISGVALLMTIFFFLMRNAAYVRPYRQYLRLVTPFLRLNISYKRINQTKITEMTAIFPLSKLSRWQRDSMDTLLRRTAIIVELKSFPISQTLLRLFLSPFFFKDKSPHFVFLVDDWMRFSTELESFRAGGELIVEEEKSDTGSILSSLSFDE